MMITEVRKMLLSILILLFVFLLIRLIFKVVFGALRLAFSILPFAGLLYLLGRCSGKGGRYYE